VCVGVGVPCVFFPTLALHGCLVLACNAWHSLLDE
jgi:hypothetical protein